jgi:hypothetical protein
MGSASGFSGRISLVSPLGDAEKTRFRPSIDGTRLSSLLFPRPSPVASLQRVFTAAIIASPRRAHHTDTPADAF